jgi:hypothetical protein
MGLKRAADAAYAFRFLRLLTKDWTDMKAYELGLIDENGKKIRSPKTPEEKNQYTLFHRLIYNIKRSFNLLPSSVARKFGSYAAALYLIKESTGIDEDILLREFQRLGFDFYLDECTEEEFELREGFSYQLSTPIPTDTDEFLVPAGTKVVVQECIHSPHFGQTFYRAYHPLSRSTLFLTSHNVDLCLGEETTAAATSSSSSTSSSASVSTKDVALPPVPKKTKKGDQYYDFDVPSEVFRRFRKGRKKYSRWKNLLDMNDDSQKRIAEFARKNRKAKVVLRDETTGALQAIRRTSSDGF